MDIKPQHIISAILAVVLIFLVPSSAFAQTESTVEISAYYAASNNIDDDFSDVVIAGWNSMAGKIDISRFDMSVEEAQAAYFSLMNMHPEYFYVNNASSINYYSTTGIASAIVPSYIFTKSELPARKAEFNSAVDEALKCVDDNMTDVEKALAIHDYISYINAYDPIAAKGSYNINDIDLTSFSAYGCLVKNVSVCQGLSDAYALLMNRLGIECIVTLSDTMSHAWNIITLNGKNYHIDLTWDDQGCYNDETLMPILSYSNHTYFLLSDSEIKEKGHSGWDSELTCSSYTGDKFWSDVHTHMNYKNGCWYYIQEDGKIIERQKNGTEKVIYTIPSDTFRLPDNTYKWLPKYSRLVENNGYLYFTTAKKIMRLDLDTGIAKTIYTAKFTYGYIVGLGIVDGELKYDHYIDQQQCEILLSTGYKAFDSQVASGDVDHDGTVNGKDVLQLRKYLVKLTDDVDESESDLNNDGKINLKDVFLLRKSIIGVA